MNLQYQKFDALDSRTKTFAELMGFLIPVALELNSSHSDLMADFEKNQRTGQCNASYGDTGGKRTSFHFKPMEEIEIKIRFAVAGNNKFNYLLENDVLTTPDMPELRLSKGGIRIHNRIVTTSGFHPLINEATSIINYAFIYEATVEKLNRNFNNPFVEQMFFLPPDVKSFVEW